MSQPAVLNYPQTDGVVRLGIGSAALDRPSFALMTGRETDDAGVIASLGLLRTVDIFCQMALAPSFRRGLCSNLPAILSSSSAVFGPA